MVFFNERAQVIVLTALMLPVLLGFAGLAIDVGVVLVHRTERQKTADAAALAAAQYLAYNPTNQSTAKSIGCAYAQKNGYGTESCPNDEVMVALPPSTGPRAGNTNFVEVRVSRTDATFFMKVLGVSSTHVSARAVAGVTDVPRNYALIVLNSTQCDSFTTASSIAINGGGAIVDSNATSGGSCLGRSANQNGGSNVTATDCKNKAGNPIPCSLDYNPLASWLVPSNSVASPSPTKAPLYPDPLSCGPPDGSEAHVEDDYCPRPVPCSNSASTLPYVGCIPWSATSAGSGNKANQPTITQLTGAGEVIMQPGTYFGGLRVSSASQIVRFSPGIYVLAGSDHNGNGGGFTYTSGRLCGLGAPGTCPVAEGVTFFNTSNPYANQAANRPCQSLDITGSGLLKFAAPTVRHTLPLTGYKYMLFWQDDSCTESFKFAGSSSGTSWSTSGIMYFPKANMKVTGGGDFGSVQIIVDTFTHGGSQDIKINYSRYVDTENVKYALVE